MILMNKRALLTLCAAASAVALAACSGGTGTTAASGQSGSQGLRVMASFYPLKYLTEQVGGAHVTVTSLTPDGAEPHDLDLSPAVVDSIGRADAVVYLKGFQTAVDEAVEQQSPKTAIDLAPAVTLVDAGEGSNHPADEDEEGQSGHEEQSGHEGHEEGHSHEGHEHHHDMAKDPHFWLDPQRMADAASFIGEQLAAADPANANDYRANASTTADSMRQIAETLGNRTASCESKTFVTAHTAFGYLADRAGLTQVGISGLDPDSSPSAARLQEIAEVVKSQGVTTIFTESLIDPKVAQTLADDLGIGTAVLDPIESQADASKDYTAVMNENIDALAKALNCQ
mgnify:FL=1